MRCVVRVVSVVTSYTRARALTPMSHPLSGANPDNSDNEERNDE